LNVDTVDKTNQYI